MLMIWSTYLISFLAVPLYYRNKLFGCIISIMSFVLITTHCLGLCLDGSLVPLIIFKFIQILILDQSKAEFSSSSRANSKKMMNCNGSKNLLPSILKIYKLHRLFKDISSFKISCKSI